ncbi:hypothetical protein FVE85_6883 [Porphyridium purpureum]|uniref:Uncharacterized protein n=1 Tax=Porphyridium purpureum TaxID=35688 RepID=A0A5J4Z816_PORPP|nr:hypothetical protein FVE85_6883 [Porphyridium purpureum]|eukprot:POR0809..scf295_1
MFGKPAEQELGELKEVLKLAQQRNVALANELHELRIAQQQNERAGRERDSHDAELAAVARQLASIAGWMGERGQIESVQNGIVARYDALQTLETQMVDLQGQLEDSREQAAQARRELQGMAAAEVSPTQSRAARENDEQHASEGAAATAERESVAQAQAEQIARLEQRTRELEQQLDRTERAHQQELNATAAAHDAQRAGMQREVDAGRRTEDALRHDLGAVQHIHAMQMQELGAVMDELQMQRDEAEAAATELGAHFARLESEYARSVAEVRRLEQDMSRIEQSYEMRLVQLDDELSRRTTMQQAAQASLAESEHQARVAQEDLLEARTARLIALDRQRALNERVDTLEYENDEMRDKLYFSTEQLVAARGETESARAELGECLRHIRELNAQIARQRDEMRAATADAREQTAALEEQISVLERSGAALREQLTTATQENARLEERLIQEQAEARRTVAEIRSELQVAGEDQRALRRRVIELEGENRSRADTIAQLEAERDQLRQRRVRAHAEITALEQRQTLLFRTVDKLRGQLAGSSGSGSGARSAPSAGEARRARTLLLTRGTGGDAAPSAVGGSSSSADAHAVPQLGESSSGSSSASRPGHGGGLPGHILRAFSFGLLGGNTNRSVRHNLRRSSSRTDDLDEHAPDPDDLSGKQP